MEICKSDFIKQQSVLPNYYFQEVHEEILLHVVNY